jgi:hypothetical protein
MGTNFYWRDRPCASCERYDEIHVGKSGFIWRGYRHRLFNDDHPDWGYDPESPFGFEVASVGDWRKIFAERPGELWDEYGRRIEDAVAWLDGTRPPTVEWRRQNDAWRREGDDTWYDPDGHYFVAYEFS